MTIIKLNEAKAHLGKYARKAASGRSFIISDRNKPVAQLTALPDEHKGIRPKIGLMDGLVRVPADFDAPLPDFEKDFYGA